MIERQDKSKLVMSSTTILTNSSCYSYAFATGKRTTLRFYWEKNYNYLIIKRVFDFFASLVLILCIFPWLFPILVFLIKLDSRGPILFKQKRVGFLGRVFWCYKFRTMYVNDVSDTQQATRNDKRITRMGKFLRNTGIDELPQLLNVLAGHMSIVGPRPHMLKDTHDFAELVTGYKFRNLVRPGITGMSQIRGCRGPASDFSSVLRRYQWDSYYVRNVSFFLDLKIVVETFLLTLRAISGKIEEEPEVWSSGGEELTGTKKIA